MGFGSHYGARICEGLVQIGMVVFDIETNGDYEWKLITSQLPHTKAQTLDF